MRLIDADAFEVLSWDDTGDTPYDQGFDDGVLFVTEKIDAAPTIDAIPVEWLREKMQKPQITCANPFGFVLAEWLEEQEAR